MEEDQHQPFAAFVLEALTHQSTELGQRWAERAQLAVVSSSKPDNNGNVGMPDSTSAEYLVRMLLVAAIDGAYRDDFLIRTGVAIGAKAHRQDASLHLMLKELDLLGTLLLRGAELVAAKYKPGGTGHEGLAVARRIADATSQLRLAATIGYTQAIEDALRERYRALRHDLRNPLGTIKSAVALLTDENVPMEMRESPRVRAMVVRNTSSLDQMIGEALGDAAARLRAFDAAQEISTESSADSSTSAREQRDDVARARQRPDLEPGAL
jgi:hypothetical protein